MAGADQDDGKDTLRSTFADATNFVAGLVADGKEGSTREKIAKGLRVTGAVAAALPTPEEASAAWAASPLGRFERQLRKAGIVRDRIVDTEHLKRGGSSR